MSATDDDPLDDLRAAWEALPGETATRQASRELGLEHEDAETRAAVELLRRAWGERAAAAPAAGLAALELAQRRRLELGSRRPRRLAPLLALAAAAGLLLWLAFDRPSTGPSPEAELARASARTDSVPNSPSTEPLSGASLADFSVPPERFHSRPDGIELTSGKVRLVLVQPTRSEPTAGNAADANDSDYDNRKEVLR